LVIRGNGFCAKAVEQKSRRKKRIETSENLTPPKEPFGQPLSEGEGSSLKKDTVRFLFLLNKMILF